nr:putative tail fiber [uncultured Mediterranean phage uvMED]
MTVSSTTVKNSYSGNGSNNTFVYGFKIFANTDIQVIIRSSTGTETTKSLTTHYTVTGVGSASGGNVVFTSGNIPSASETVVLIRNVPQTQAIDYIANDPFPAETHEEGLDRATMTTQQVQEELNRSIKLSRTNTMTSTEFAVGATDRASKVLGFDANGELTVTQELGTNRGNWSSGTDYNARDIVKDTSTNNIFLVNTAHTASGSQPLTTNANSAKYDLIVDAASATTSASSASTSASTATTKAAEAATSASTATTKANEASTSASSAATSATNAANSFDSFDDRYLGAKASDPTVDNDGNALLTGALYFNSSDNVMKNYTGSAWQTLKPTSSEQTNINTLSASAVVTDMSILATTDVVADMNTLGTADVVSDMNTLATADVVSDMNTLATADIVSDMNTLATADVVADMNTLGTADVVTDMNTLGTATNVTNMATVATNITGVNSFAERYRVASSDPTSSLDEGDLAYNTTDNNLKFYNGTAWTSISPGIANVVDDSTPQLGGNLDVQTNSIVTTSNRNVLLAPNGTGLVEIKGNDNAGQIQLNCEQNSHGVKIKGPPHSAGQSYTLTLPSSITNGFFLKTDGSGNLSFAAAAETKPTVADVSQTIAPATATTINITGTDFVSIPQVQFVNGSTGAITNANTVSFTNATTLSVNCTLASGNYYVRIENPDGLAGRSTNNIITASTAPSFTTAAGSLGTVAGNFSGTVFTVVGTSDSAITFTETTSVLVGSGGSQANCSLASNGVITTSDFGGSSTSPTTYNFTLKITDAEGQFVTRDFSLTSSFGATGSGGFN